jgi:hypothetical protein
MLRCSLFTLIFLNLGLSMAQLNVSRLTWDVIGLDHNDVTTGPNNFPIGVRACNTSGATMTNVTATYSETGTNNTLITPSTNFATVLTRPTLPSGTLPPNRHTISAKPANCADFYFSATVTRTASAYNSTQAYTVTVTADGGFSSSFSGTLYVEKLVSQNRNSKLTLTGPSLIYVGETLTYTLTTKTATGGYEQLESVLELPFVFDITSVSASYSAPTGGINSSPYADACGWNAVTRACVGPVNYTSGKAGGNVSSVYTLNVTQPGSGNFNSLIYDFSGSSYHYNSDYSTVPGVWVTSVTAWRAPTITKSFSPATIGINGVSTLSITIANASDNPASLTGISLTDTYPTGVVNTTPASSSTTCSGGSVLALAGTTSATLSGATLAPGASCTITVSVTASTIGNYTNTINANTLSSTQGVTNKTAASAVLTVASIPRIGLAKALHNVIPTSNASGNNEYTLVYKLTLENFGDTALSSITVFDDIASIFSGLSPRDYNTWLGIPANAATLSPAATLTRNSTYDGTATSNLLSTGQTLPIGSSKIVYLSFTVTVNPFALSPNNTLRNNQAEGRGTSGASTVVTDLSTNGDDPDGTVNNNSPDEAVTTPTAFVKLIKEVRNCGTNLITCTGTYAYSATGKPGDYLEYRLSAYSISSQAISALSMSDTLVAATPFQEDTYAIVGATIADFSLVCPNASTVDLDRNSTAISTIPASGPITVFLLDVMAPGACNIAQVNSTERATVVFKVKIP